MEVIMDPDGWDDREVSVYCPLCNTVVIWHSVYLNMDMLIEMNMTQAEFALQLHNNDDHTYDEDTKTWSA